MGCLFWIIGALGMLLMGQILDFEHPTPVKVFATVGVGLAIKATLHILYDHFKFKRSLKEESERFSRNAERMRWEKGERLPPKIRK